MTPKHVILHCAATDDSRRTKIPVEEIDRWHKRRGWKGIGYQWYITRDGKTWKGREETEVGAHCRDGGMNRKSIGICYEGTYFPTVKQIVAIVSLYRGIKERWEIPYTEWHGHRDFAIKTCPGFPTKDIRDLLKEVD